MEKVRPIVGVIMGSKSDYPVMKSAAETLDRFDIPHEVRIVSAHRTPDWMSTYAKNAVKKKIRIIIAGAGGAAHLPGMVASLTEIPLIGVPITSTHSALNGLDSLLSILQMPTGVPVATVALNNSTNAALLAVRILALDDSQLREKLIQFQNQQRENVLTLDQALQKKQTKDISK